MEKWKAALYRALLWPLPRMCDGKKELSLPRETAQTGEAILRILRAHHAVGACVAVFDRDGITATVSYGDAVLGSMPVTEHTVFRAASISKHITAMAAFRLAEEGTIDLDADVDAYLPCSLRHPDAPDTPVTLRRLFSHTAGIHDGKFYVDACTQNPPLNEVMQDDSFAAVPDAFEYSNLGAGIAACVLEGMLQKGFESIMQDALFAPLGITATFYPQNASGDIANAYRVLPPAKAPALDNAVRRARPKPSGMPDPAHHYLLAQGNLYISAPELARLGMELATARYAPMRTPIAPFGRRADNLTEGLGTFIVNDPSVCPQTVYGHQGLAYGAMHGLFYDPATGRGFALLTSGASEARVGVLSDINKALIKKVLSHD